MRSAASACSYEGDVRVPTTLNETRGGVSVLLKDLLHGDLGRLLAEVAELGNTGIIRVSSAGSSSSSWRLETDPSGSGCAGTAGTDSVRCTASSSSSGSGFGTLRLPAIWRAKRGNRCRRRRRRARTGSP